MLSITRTNRLLLPAMLAVTGCSPGLPGAGEPSVLAALAMLVLGGGFCCLVLTPLRQRAGNLIHRGPVARLEQQLSEMREQLVVAERRNQQLLDNAGDAMFFIDPRDGTILDQNRVCEKLLGYSNHELSSLELPTLLPADQSRKYLRLVKTVLNKGYGEASELEFRTRSGRSFTGAVHARLGMLGNRQVVHGVIRDVTRLKQIEQELRQRNRELTLINQITFKAAESHSLNDVLQTVRGMVVEAFAADGAGIYLSKRQGNQLELVTHEGFPDDILAELKTLPPDQGLIGRVLTRGLPVTSRNLQQDRRLWSQAVRRSNWQALQAVPLGSHEQTIGVLFIVHRSRRSYSRDEVRLLQAIGRQVGIIIASADLLEELTWQNRLTRATNRELQTSRQLLSENLKRERATTRTLERIEKMKSNFLALASHELRTPLTYILSGSQLLLEDLDANFSAAQKKLLGSVYQGGKRLEEIVSNLLEITRLEGQNIYLGQEPIDLELLFAELGQTLQPALTENRLQLDIHRPLPDLEQLRGDRDHLGKALQRLLENAIKFTPPEGKITLACQVLTRQQILAQQDRLQRFREPFFRQELTPNYLQLTVSDTGIGIDPEEHLQIFDKFYEVGDIDGHFTSRTRFGGKGVGLGLALVKGMIEAHNGLVWVESPGAGGGGSAFHLLLPLPETSELEQSRAEKLNVS